MRIKLDENLDPRAKEILINGGHEVASVEDQGLKGRADADIARVVREERRCLIILDLDFSNVLVFPPEQYSGIIVLRHPDPTSQRLLTRIHQIEGTLRTQDPTRKLWIVKPGRLRVHQSAELEDSGDDGWRTIDLC